jgi:hypothetical protein
MLRNKQFRRHNRLAHEVQQEVFRVHPHGHRNDEDTPGHNA